MKVDKLLLYTTDYTPTLLSRSLQYLLLARLAFNPVILTTEINASLT